MEMVEGKRGRFAKNGVRYNMICSLDETRAEAESNAFSLGYTKIDPLTLQKEKQKKNIAAARYEAEFGGFTDPSSGLFVRTDNRTRPLLTAAAIRAVSDPSYEVANWKTSEGSFITLPNAMILALDQAVRDFIAAQFAKEAALYAQIDSATTSEEVRAITWT